MQPNPQYSISLTSAQISLIKDALRDFAAEANKLGLPQDAEECAEVTAILDAATAPTSLKQTLRQVAQDLAASSATISGLDEPVEPTWQENATNAAADATTSPDLAEKVNIAYESEQPLATLAYLLDMDGEADSLPLPPWMVEKMTNDGTGEYD